MKKLLAGMIVGMALLGMTSSPAGAAGQQVAVALVAPTSGRFVKTGPDSGHYIYWLSIEVNGHWSHWCVNPHETHGRGGETFSCRDERIGFTYHTDGTLTVTDGRRFTCATPIATSYDAGATWSGC